MASRISRREWVRGLPPASGVGKYDRKRAHSASERSVGYGFLIRKSVRNHPNPHLYQTGSNAEGGKQNLERRCPPPLVSRLRAVAEVQGEARRVPGVARAEGSRFGVRRPRTRFKAPKVFGNRAERAYEGVWQKKVYRSGRGT